MGTLLNVFYKRINFALIAMIVISAVSNTTFAEPDEESDDGDDVETALELDS